MKGQKDMAPKVQACALRVSIHCEGCKHKVKNLLKKVKGVEKVNIDDEQGKVTIFGVVDPQILVSKLEKSGKHAEIWDSRGRAPPVFNVSNQFSKFPVVGGNKKDNNNFKAGGGFQPQKQQLNPEKGPKKDSNFFSQKDDKKSVKFKLPQRDEEEEEDEESDFGSDEGDDDFGSEESDDGGGFVSPPPKKPTKAASHGDESKKGTKKGSNGIDKLIKAMLGKSMGKGNSEKKKDKNKNNGDVKTGKEKKGSSVVKVDAIKGGKIKIPQMPSSKNKKKGSNLEGTMPMGSNHNKNFDFMSQQGNLQGMPYGPVSAAHKGPPRPPPQQFQGFDMGGNFNGQYSNNPQYAQQQQQMMMMMMNQQRMMNQNGHGPPQMHHPMMGYGPPPQQMMAPADDRYTHMFNDENTGSCSVM